MCSVRFKIFKSVICQHYEVNTHVRTTAFLSVTEPRAPPHPPACIKGTWRGLLWLWQENTQRPVSVISQQPYGHAARCLWENSGKCVQLRVKKKKKKREKRKRKRRERKPLNVSPVYLTQWLWRSSSLFLYYGLNWHSLLIWWLRLLRSRVSRVSPNVCLVLAQLHLWPRSHVVAPFLTTQCLIVLKLWINNQEWINWMGLKRRWPIYEY